MPGLGRFTSLDRVLDIVIQGVSSLQGAIQYNDAPDRTQDECITVMMEAEKRCGITSIFQLRGDPLFYEVCEQCLEPIKWEFFYDESGGYQTGACISHHIEYNRVDEIIVRAEE